MSADDVSDYAMHQIQITIINLQTAARNFIFSQISSLSDDECIWDRNEVSEIIKFLAAD